MKVHHTEHRRLCLPEHIHSVQTMLFLWSTDSVDLKAFRTEPLVEPECYKMAYHWIKNELKMFKQTDILYVVTTPEYEPLVPQYKAILNKNISYSFADIVKSITTALNQ